MVKAIGAAIIVLGSFHVRWVMWNLSTDAIEVAARHGLSLYRVAPPYNRWGVDWRCDIWTLCGVFIGVLLGFGLGWAMLDSLPLGILLAGAGALIAGWRYRVVASLLAVDRRAHGAAEEPRPAEHPESAPEPLEARHGGRGGRVKLALAAVVCGVFVAAVWLSRVDVHGPIVVIGFVATVAFVAWRVTGIVHDQRAA